MSELSTIADLKLLCARSQPNTIWLNWLLATTHPQRLEVLYAAIDWIAAEHMKTRQVRHDRGEDALSVDIVTDLKAMGFEASHDTQYGGHCDIVVEAADNFLWIGEAKKHSTYDWLLKGFQQLDTRYTTGIPGQDAGGMIIYHLGQDTKSMMETWIKHLVEKRPDVSVEPCSKNPLIHYSSHIHKNSGLTFRVRHVAINLRFAPEDK